MAHCSYSSYTVATVFLNLKKVFFNFLITVECQPTDADHEGTSIEEDEVVLKKASKKGQEGGTEIKCLCSTQET